MAGVQIDVPLYTGNHVLISIDGQTIGLVETMTVTRSVNRQPAYQVGTPLFADAPVTQAIVQVQLNNLVPLQGVPNAEEPLSQLGITPTGTLVSELGRAPMTVEAINLSDGAVAYGVEGAYYNNDAVQVQNTQMLTLNMSFVAQDSTAWT